MKKAALFVSLFLLVAVLLTAVAVSASKSFDPDDLRMITSDRVNLKADLGLEVSVDFFILASDIDFLSKNAAEMSIYATVLDYYDTVVDPSDSLGINILLKQTGDRLLEKLYINGEERYFEIHNGKIRLVV